MVFFDNYIILSMQMAISDNISDSRNLSERFLSALELAQNLSGTVIYSAFALQISLWAKQCPVSCAPPLHECFFR